MSRRRSGPPNKGEGSRDLAMEFGKAEAREERKGNMKAARSFGKAELREESRAISSGGSRKSRGSSNGGRSYDSDITRPYSYINPITESKSQEKVINSVSGRRVFSNYPYSGHIYPNVPAVMVLEPDLDMTFNRGLFTPASDAIKRLQTAIDQIYFDVIQYVQDKRFISNLTFAAIHDWSAWLSTVMSVYTGLRGFQSILECPAQNVIMAQIKSVVYDFRIRIESDLDNVLNYPLPRKIYEYLDNLCGCFQNCCGGCLKIQIPNIPDNLKGYSGGTTAADLLVSNDVDLALKGLEAELQAITNGTITNGLIISDVMRLAYPTSALTPKPLNCECCWYDNLRFQSVVELEATPNGAPLVETDRDGTVVICNCCCDYDPQYMTLFRNSPLIGAGSLGADGAYGLIRSDNTNYGLNGKSYPFNWNGTTVPTVDIVTALAAGDTVTGAVMYEFPWAWVAENSSPTQSSEIANTQSILDNYCLLVANMDDLVEETIFLLKDAFAMGLR